MRILDCQPIVRTAERLKATLPVFELIRPKDQSLKKCGLIIHSCIYIKNINASKVHEAAILAHRAAHSVIQRTTTIKGNVLRATHAANAFAYVLHAIFAYYMVRSIEMPADLICYTISSDDLVADALRIANDYIKWAIL